MCVTCARHATHTCTGCQMKLGQLFLLSLESRKEKAERKGFCFGSIIVTMLFIIIIVAVMLFIDANNTTIFYLLVNLSTDSFLAGVSLCWPS